MKSKLFTRFILKGFAITERRVEAGERIAYMSCLILVPGEASRADLG
jgi:hypothetical protein